MERTDSALVSVIIPVYKAERFLDECLESVIGQNYPAIEIILADDGSPDSCPEICDRYAEAYDNIEVIHQDNRGPGPARNAGLDAASGKYVAFVDSDDILDGKDSIRLMVERAEEERADIVVGSFRSLGSRAYDGVSHHRLEGGPYTETVDFRFKGFALYNHLSFPWGKLYRRAFLSDNDLRFPDYPFSQDKSFNMMCCACRPVYAFVDGSVYRYRTDNSDSVTFRYRDYVAVWIAIASDFEAFLFRRGIEKAYDDLIAFHLCFGLFLLAAQELKYKGISDTAEELSRYGRDPLVHRMAKQMAHSRHIDQIESKKWRVIIWTASVLCEFHAYLLMAFGIWTLRKIKADRRFVSSRYRS